MCNLEFYSDQVMLKQLLPLVLTASFAFSGRSQTTQIEVKSLNYADLSEVQQFNKLELGVKLPDQILTRVNNFLKGNTIVQSDKINPFLQWELDLEATFVHEQTGIVKKVPAFYYREYERDPSANSWKDIGTQHPMRIRFAPVLVGKWKCTVTCKVKGKPQEAIAPIELNVIKSQNKGFITVHPNKRNFQLNGELVYPVGTNFPSPTKGVSNYHTGPNGDLFSPAETFKVTKLAEWMSYHEDIRNYAEQGGKFIRTLQAGWSSLLEYEKKGNYYDRQPYAWEQDRLLEYCEQNGVYIHFNLMQQEPFMCYGNYHFFDWDWSHFRDDFSYFDQDAYPGYCYSDGKKKMPHESMTSDDDMRYHEQRTRYYIARYGYSTSIYLFELLSEPWHVDEFSGHEEPFTMDNELGQTIRKAVQNYHERLAVYIKETLGHTNQLIGIDIYSAKFYEGETFLDQSVYHPAIDVVSFNPYTAFPDKMIIAKSSDNNLVLETENSMARMVLTLSEKCGKPIMIAEGGAGDGVDECSDFSQQYLDMMAFGFTGLAGYNSWVGWFTNHEQTLPSIIAAQEHMNSEVLRATLNSLWIQGRQAERHMNRDSKKGKELQYYLSGDLKTVAGYVKNRSYNFYTKRTNDNCAKANFEHPFDELTDMRWDDGGRPLYVEGLEKNKTYQITWYEYKTGAVITVECVKPRRGRLKLRFPELSVTAGKPERPALWFTMTQQECQL